MRLYLLSVLSLIPLIQQGCPGDDDDDTTTEPSPSPQPSPTPSEYGIPQRESNGTCIVEGSPEEPSSMQLVRSFPNLSFSSPVFITHAGDNTDRLFVVEQRGTIRVFPNNSSVTSSTAFLDIRAQVADSSSEMGLLGLAFHPDYEHNGYFYVNYTADPPRRTVISRFSVSADPDSADDATEEVLLEISQPYTNHNGGMVAFGPDGYLYIGMGDGGSGGDPSGNGQNETTLLGDILRIDVDNPSNGNNYGIPADNPYATATDGSRPEIFASGMRNPWRFSFDRVTDRLWAGDVGQDLYEEIDIIELGKNYGWNVMEGFHCYGASSCNTSGLSLPIHEYPHSQGVSITGGYVYRGNDVPELYGKYLYADYSVGRIWALTYDGSAMTSNVELLDSSYYLSSFGETEDGELLVLNYSGTIMHLEPASGGGSDAEFPTRLTDTGCFSNVATREPAAGVIGYDVNSPLYADYAHKDRFFAIPDTTTIGFTSTGAWNFPDGAVTFKDFFIEQELGNPASKRLLETRMFVKQNGEWAGYTYKWNDEQTDAFLLDSSFEETYTLTQSDGSTIDYTHYYPSRYDCQSCHTSAAGFALGLQTGQMNRDFQYETALDNQLRAYDHAGLFDTAVAAPYDQYAKYPVPSDSSQSLSLRARSYLHANCSHCHLPGGSAVSTIDFRYETALNETNACNVEPSQGDLGYEDALLIRPGDASLSIVSLRMHSVEDEERMPPLASSVVDDEGTQIIDQWIDQLTGCE